MGLDRARVGVASAALVAIATVLLLGVMLSACGDKFAGKWREKDGTRVLEIRKASGNA